MKAVPLANTIQLRSGACQADPDSHAIDHAGKSLTPALQMLRAAIDESGWKHAAIASALSVEPQYLSRMLSGEKVWTVRHLQLLPDDVEALFIRKYAESFGLIVIERVSDELARQQLASGLFNMLAPRLPVKAGAPIKADLPEQTKRSGAR